MVNSLIPMNNRGSIYREIVKFDRSGECSPEKDCCR